MNHGRLQSGGFAAAILSDIDFHHVLFWSHEAAAWFAVVGLEFEMFPVAFVPHIAD